MRKLRKLSQETLATKAGLQQGDVSKIENGRILRTTALPALARALECDVDWLDTGAGHPTLAPAAEETRATYVVLSPRDVVDSLVIILEKADHRTRDVASHLMERLGRDPLGPWANWLIDAFEGKSEHLGETSATVKRENAYYGNGESPPDRSKPVTLATSTASPIRDPKLFNLDAKGKPRKPRNASNKVKRVQKPRDS